MSIVLSALPYLTVGLAAGAAISSVLNVSRRVVAERKLAKLIGTDANLQRLRMQLLAEHADGTLSDDQLAAMTEALEKIATHLRRSERRLVLAALHQPSQRGRERYIEKLLHFA